MLDLETGIAFALLSMFGFGISNFFIGKSAKKIGAFRNMLWFTTLQIIILLLLAPFFFVQTGITTTIILIIIAAAAISTVSGLAFSKGLTIGNMSVIAPVTSASAIITVILAFVFLDQKLGVLQIFYIAMVIAGTMLVSVNTDNLFKSNSKKLHIGIEYAVLAAIGYGVFFFLISIITQALDWFSAYFLMMIPRLLILLIFGYITRSRFNVQKSTVPNLFFISVLILIGFLSFNLGVTFNYTDIVAPISAADAIVTVILAVLFLREKLTGIQKFGIVIGVVGLILLSL